VKRSINKNVGMLNVRDKNSSDSRWWSPDRDITTLYPRVMRWVFHKLNKALSPGDPDFNPAAYSIKGQYSVTDDKLINAGKAYAKFISCIELREDTTEFLDHLGFRHDPAQTVIAIIFLERMTELFAEKYGATLHKGEDDPNKENLQALVATLKQFGEPEEWPRIKALRRLGQCMFATLRCLVKPSGRNLPK